MRAFDRLAKDPNRPRPPYLPRSVRLGMDYAMRVAGVDPKTDEEADTTASLCLELGTAIKADIARGDRPRPAPRTMPFKRKGMTTFAPLTSST